MTVTIQILVLIISFLYGILFSFLWKLNELITHKQKRFFRSLTTILFMYLIVLCYLIILYKTNHGQFHIYFFIMIVIGTILGNTILKKVQENVKLKKLLEKYKKKWYSKKE